MAGDEMRAVVVVVIIVVAPAVRHAWCLLAQRPTPISPVVVVVVVGLGILGARSVQPLHKYHETLASSIIVDVG